LTGLKVLKTDKAFQFRSTEDIFMRTLPLIALAVIAAPVLAQPVNNGLSQIGFTLKELNVPVDGQFRQFDAKVNFDPVKLQASQADITIQTASIALPTTEADNQAKQKEWFDAAQFPTAHFVSTGIKPLSGGRYQVSGKLTIKGTTRDVTAAFSSRQEDGATVLEGTFPISRLAYKIGDGEWADTDTVADVVEIRFHLALK
jgi:polyisoprenoid-binding protein YceI